MIFQGSCTYAVNLWVPIYFLRVHHWTAGQTGKALAFIMIIFACSGMYIGGLLSDRWQKNGVGDGPIRVALLSGVGILLFLAPATITSNAYATLSVTGGRDVLHVFSDGDIRCGASIDFP
jgi:sugar phosphate permease